MSIEVQSPFGDETVTLWAEPDGPIMLKVVEPSGDPVELNEAQALHLADLLRALAHQISD